ncbi:hypothetical protein BDN72DRAFT_795723 [Pluteus cervinus]|uniref:Uncharacterized protein n=1 Tax=Pluteus cervinus TaxID=181527 RepID=A0ACD3AWC7_9AGAR|nr:hypothetical protein BDN72DRAFT_795723 [Pluteus cervinus]
MSSRRVLVVIQDGGSIKKLALSIRSDATIADLANEIVRAGGVPAVTLEVGDGFELRGQDGIDLISDGEIVTARVQRGTEDITDPSPSQNQDTEMADPPPYSRAAAKRVPAQRSTDDGDKFGRVRITLVSAQLARSFAAGNTKTLDLPQNGVQAFEGEFISGNTSLNAVRREAAQLFGWASDDSMDADDDCTHDKTLACSCAIAGDISENGLRSTMHCRFSSEGEPCRHSDCPFSHTPLITTGLGTSGFGSVLTCSICSESLTSACPKCLADGLNDGKKSDAIVHCSLTQNTGCDHLHHTHCVGKRDAQTSVGCPSGCPQEAFPREAKVFDVQDPHLVLVWDGDKIAKIPIPPSYVQEGSRVRIASEVIVNLVEKHLIAHECDVGGLTLRIHGRDPVSETTSFTQSTLVSVCPTSEHKHNSATYKRFDLFPTKTVAPLSNGHFEDGTQSFIDLHTSETPIVACGCTPLSQLFPCPPDGSVSITLYAVKRNTNKDDKSNISGLLGTKESTYLSTSAWQPSISQSSRGMSALLSSLYVLAHSVSKRGIVAEQKVLSTIYALTRFPPAVRALGVLLLNKNLEAWEKAALSESIFHTVKDIAANGPSAITKAPDRTLETSRILLGHIISSAAASSTETAERPLEEILLRCGLSEKRLVEPMLMSGTTMVETSTANIYMTGGELFRPNTSDNDFIMVESVDFVCQILAHSRQLDRPGVSALKLDKLGAPPTSVHSDLKSLGRNINLVIKSANETDLVSRGPLDLKSTSVVPPQIVLDSDGFLAVFTGRGCGAEKDVNFFRPARGGDTEVDVNDVGHALESVTETRKAEGTWEVDSYSGVSAISRPPAEAVVICLDLSESMNKKSGVSKSDPSASEREEFDVDVEAAKAVAELTSKVSSPEIMVKAKKYLEELHPACHHAWKLYINSQSLGTDLRAARTLLKELQKIATRDVLRLSSLLEENPYHSYGSSDKPSQLACLSHTIVEHPEELSTFLVALVNKPQETSGHEPYQVPRNLLDPKTGNLFTNPVRPTGSPTNLFVDEDSRAWFESQDTWPVGYFVPAVASSAKRIQEAVNRWVSGVDILPTNSFFSRRTSRLEVVDIVFTHEGKSRTWSLSINTPIRKLYMLVHRATRAKYTMFTIRLASTKVTISDSTTTTIGVTDLASGGEIEICRTFPHQRKLIEFKVEFETFKSSTRILLLPADAPVLAVISYLNGVADFSKLMIWHGLKASGDGVRRGSLWYNENTLAAYRYASEAVEIECSPWFYLMEGAIETRQRSRHLSRLHLMSELFNVFINRASSFDTSVALVLGLVTFSNNAQVKQQLTPIFENFRRELETVDAAGDTAVYDALEVAKSVLVNYRTDIPGLRRRIIIVSDGDDTCSKASASSVCESLQKQKIVVDSVQVGTSHNGILHAISVATGGYRFFPKTSLGDALSIFDLETMLNSAERPKRSVMPTIWSMRGLRDYAAVSKYPVDVVTVDKFPQRAEHPRLKESVSAASKKLTLPLTGDERIKRIMREIQRLVSDPHPHIDVYVNDRDISFFKIVMEAPDDIAECPYKGGAFLLTCDLPAGYPRDPPEFRFVTFILHPNVSKQGKVCVAELGRLWSSDLTLKEALAQIYGLLLEPDLDNPLEIQASLKYYDDDGTYALAAANAVQEHASKSREQWKKELAPGSV